MRNLHRHSISNLDYESLPPALRRKVSVNCVDVYFRLLPLPQDIDLRLPWLGEDARHHASWADKLPSCTDG